MCDMALGSPGRMVRQAGSQRWEHGGDLFGQRFDVFDDLPGVPQVMGIGAAQATQAGQGCEGGEQRLLEGAGWAGEPNGVVELAGEEGCPEQTGAAGPIRTAVCCETEQ